MVPLVYCKRYLGDSLEAEVQNILNRTQSYVNKGATPIIHVNTSDERNEVCEWMRFSV
jgi:hypothetical protein